jgi:hypothetical protein
VAEEEILDESQVFVEKDSGLGNSLSSSTSGEMSPSSLLNSFDTIGAAADDCETESLTTCLQLEKTAQRSDRPGNISKLCHFLAIYAVICKCWCLNFWCSDPATQIIEVEKEDESRDEESVLPDNGSPVAIEFNNPALCEEFSTVVVLGLLIYQYLKIL